MREGRVEKSVFEIVRPGRRRPEGGRVVLVSNRLPLTRTSIAGGVRPSSGGLAAGLRQVAKRWPAVWVGWDGIGRPAGTPAVETVQPWENGTVVALSMDEREVAHFYRLYSNALLWPVLHGRIADLPPDDADWQAYRAMNRRYADAVLRQTRPGDIVWVHDYHLMLLPRLLRQKAPDLPIAFFLHTSFPDAEAFRSIPQGRELLNGLLGADTIGFHTPEYADNFLRTAEAFGLRVRGRRVVGDRVSRIKVHPMGIDAEAFGRLAEDADVLEDAADIRRSHPRLLLGVDRLDYTKGIPQRLLAFEMLLEKQPGLRGDVSFLQVAVPTREELPAYRDLREVVESLVHRINSRFGKASWTPVEYIPDSVDLGTLAALYRAADVMVVTPVRDGLNLVAKEFVATRTDEDGVLVLSRFAGAAAELEAALHVDPTHLDALAATFHAALKLPLRERRRRMRALRRAIAANTVFDWAGDFLDSLATRLGRAPWPGKEPIRPRGRSPVSSAWGPLPATAGD